MSILQTQWKDIMYAQIAFYAITLSASTILVLRLFKFSRNHGGGFVFKKLAIYVCLIPLFKIVGGSCAIVVVNQVNKLTDPSVGLVVVAVLFNTVCVGFMLIMPVIYLRHIALTDTRYAEYPPIYEIEEGKERESENESENERESKYHSGIIENRLDLLINVTNILVIVGASLSSSADDVTTAKNIILAASFLYLANWLIVTYMTIQKYRIYQSSKDSNDTRFGVGKMFIFYPPILIFLLIRIIYSICSAFGFKGYDLIGIQSVSKFAFLFGDFKYYVGMAFFEEFLVLIGILFIGYTIDPNA